MRITSHHLVYGAVAFVGLCIGVSAQTIPLVDVLAGERGFVIEGAEALERIGIIVVNAGDVNGDGLDDILVAGVRPPSSAVSLHYLAYVVFGKAEMSAVDLADVRTGTGGFAICFEGEFYQLSLDIRAAGDVNDDGLADIAVAMLDADPFGRADAGTAYIVFGKASTAPVLLADVDAGNGGFPIYGESAGDWVASVDGAHDVNDDGFDDLVIGAINFSEESIEHSGRAYVVFGSETPAALDLTDIATSGRGFRIRSYQPFRVGIVRAAGDVNNDGLADVLVTSGTGYHAVVFGKSDSLDVLLGSLQAEEEGFLLSGLNTSAGEAGDVNGDGYGDLVLGNADAEFGLYVNSGAAYVVFGKPDYTPVQAVLGSISGGQGGIVLIGNKPGTGENNALGRVGASVAAVGDQNGDGLDDILVGAPGVRSGQYSFFPDGEAYIIHGTSSTPILNTSTLPSSAGKLLLSPATKEAVGTGVSGRGDVNGDGRPDMIIGAASASPRSRANAGSVYVLFGGPPNFADADGDRVSTVAETDTGLFASKWNTGSNPARIDSDRDRIPDAVERAALSDPNNIKAIPTIRPHVVDLAAVAQGGGGFTITGVSGQDRASVVSKAGDVNGDELLDVIIGAPRARVASLAAGIVYVAFGEQGNPPFHLSATGRGKGFNIQGNANDGAGYSASGAGDVNGDGLYDVIFSAPGSDLGSCQDCGAYFVAYGKTTTAPTSVGRLANNQGGFMLHGGPVGVLDGGVSGAGDVNGDGLDDVIIGIPSSEGGAAFVVFGSATPSRINLDNVATGQGGFVIEGQSEGRAFAYDVSAAGDVNGDGLDDVIVGNQLATAPEFVTGGAFVVFGRTATTPTNTTDLRAGVGGFAIDGYQKNDFYAGYHVSGAGDVNGDDLADVILGAVSASQDHAEQAGESYVVFGKASTETVDLVDVVAGSGGFVIRGIDAFDSSGASVSSAGDVNGDGLDDVLVGASGADHDGNHATGEAYVVFGKADTDPVHLFAVQAGTGGLFIKGINAFDAAGEYVSAVGDLNGDGFDDIAVGAPGTYEHTPYNPGRTYIVFGFDPPAPDRDGDLIPDYMETGTGVYAGPDDTGTDLANPDTDGDGIFDGIETGLGTDPNDPDDFPTGLPLRWTWLMIGAVLVVIGWMLARVKRRFN